MAKEWPEYLDFVRRHPCAVCGSRLQIEAHHATNGLMVPPGEPLPPKSAGPKRGRGQKCHDYFTLPLCMKHHGQLHNERRSGHFKDWSKQRLNAWQMEQVTAMRCLWEEQQTPHEDPQETQQWLDSLPF